MTLYVVFSGSAIRWSLASSDRRSSSEGLSIAPKSVTDIVLGASKVLLKLSEPIRYSPQLNAGLEQLIASVKAQGLEGLVAKRLDSKYEPGQPSGGWQKMRVDKGQELVIGGYNPSEKNSTRWSSAITMARNLSTRPGRATDSCRHNE